MEPVALAIEFTGEAVELGDGRFWAETRAAVDAFGADHALCRRDLRLNEDGSLVQAGEISFGRDDAITFRAGGTLGPSPNSGLRHGTAVFEVTGGRGRLTGASGFVTSNFLLADTGALTDHHLVLLFVQTADRGGNPCAHRS